METAKQHVQAAMDYSEAHLDTPLPLDRVAAAAGLTRYHLHRLFQAHYCEGLKAYIRKRRLTWAAARLRGSNVRILELALDCGFESQAAFTRAFKALYGTTVDSQGPEVQGEEAAAGEEATGEEPAAAAEARQEMRSSLDSQYLNMAPPGTDGDTPVTIPPRAQRMSQSVPKDVYGNERASKVVAPEVSLTAATANPNMRNLLLEVPWLGLGSPNPNP